MERTEPLGQIYGYARVSARDQNEDRQMIALRAFGVEERNIFLDKLSGKDFNRPAYARLLRKLRAGDLMVTMSIDRLGRNYSEIIEQWRVITKVKGADIAVLDMPLLDTREKDKNLTGTFISDLVLQILSYVAETERDNIRRRQAQGIAAAKARGVRFGRERTPRPPDFERICELWREGKISTREGGKLLGISHMTFYRMCLEYGGRQQT